jgi:hypothetical protein
MTWSWISSTALGRRALVGMNTILRVCIHPPATDRDRLTSTSSTVVCGGYL